MVIHYDTTVSKRRAISSRLGKFQMIFGVSTLLVSQQLVRAADNPLQVMIVGGGPSPASNQAAIESNVRYVTKLLPEKRDATILFADGDKTHATVLFNPEASPKSPAEEILDSFLRPTGRRRGPGGGGPPAAPAPAPAPATAQLTQAQQNGATAQVPRSQGNFKVPDLQQLDGPAQKTNVATAFGHLVEAKPSKQPVFLYFTGHGSKTKDDLENNYYNLWAGEKLTVQDLSQQVARLPEKEPVVLVMVQCFSGSFGNILFEGGLPNAPLIDRDIVGFYASTKDRVAAGCTPAVNEEYYYDFTSYFFSALTGRDRLDRKAAPDADFNHDGKVGLDEAFYWSIINDNSIDVPVSTSDVFLERFSPLVGDTWESTPYKSLLEWASTAQKASLNGLSAALEVTGEDRIAQVKNIDFNARTAAINTQIQDVNQRFTALRDQSRTTYLAAFPKLTSADATERTEARQQALTQITTEIGQQKWQPFQALVAERNAAQQKGSGISVIQAKQLRFLRLARKIVSDHNLRTSNNSEAKDRYFKLLKSESKTLLPYQK
ncbi:hypothetical protein EON83_01990 [bacterium]|nr:MAG: hypothetical protein EON83_01990 [bacterium]